MIDFLTGLYPTTPITQKTFLNKVRFYSGVRFFIRSLSNLVLPIYFKLNNIITHKHRLEVFEKKDLIISFTSFPARIYKVWLVVESIFRQTHKPDRIILWLSREQFPTLKSLPKDLLDQQKRGLEIKLVDEDIKSYKKYYYTLSEYPESNWIIVDDDVFYPSNLISNLIGNSKENPNSVIFNVGHRLTYNNSNLFSYTEWQPLARRAGPSFDIFATGVGGVLYPAKSLHSQALNKEAFLKHCPLADDVWLYVSTRLNNTKLVKTNEQRLFLPVIYKNSSTLTSENVNQGLNDQQIKQVRDYLRQNYFDVFDLSKEMCPPKKTRQV